MIRLQEWFLMATTRLREFNFSYEDLKILVPFLVLLLLIIWLLYRIKIRIKAIVQDEIYKSFPNIRNTIENFEDRIKLLNVEAERIEKRLNEFKIR